MRCVFRTTHCCLCTVCPLLSRITQDTIQPTDTASNTTTSTPMPAMKVVNFSIHRHSQYIEFDLIRAQGVIGNCVVACTLVDNLDRVLVLEHSLHRSSKQLHANSTKLTTVLQLDNSDMLYWFVVYTLDILVCTLEIQ